METHRYSAIPRTLNFVWDRDGDGDGKLLLIKFSDKKGKMAGWYDPPGGHVEEKEGILESGKREILEETGIVVQSIKLRGVVHVSNFFGKDILLFVTESVVDSPLLVESEEGTLEWVAVEDFDRIKIFEDLRMLIEKVKELGEGEVFSARSEFDDEGKLVRFEFE